MSFIQLGVKNAWRNLERSILAILSMAVAAGFLTYFISLSRGYPLLYKADCRAVIGGEIVVYARQFGGIIPEGESQWQHFFLDESPLSDLSSFHPELLDYGYLSSLPQKAAFEPQDIAVITEALSEAAYLYPRYQIPAVTREADGANRRSTPLRGRDANYDNLQTKHPSELVETGRWFDADDEGKRVAVISSVQKLPAGSKIPAIGDVIYVEVPSILYIENQPIYQEAQPRTYAFEIIGHIKAQTRSIEIGGPTSVPVYWQIPEVQIPLQTWQEIWAEAGGVDYRPEQITLGYDDLSHIEDVVLDFRQRIPAYSLYGVPEHFYQAERRGLIEKLIYTMEQLIVTESTQAALPLDFRLPFTILIFINAALVVAANLLILAHERRMEIGVLKAVGAQRSQIMRMVLSEALLISSVGVSLGFIFFRIPATLNQLTHALHMSVIAASIVYDAVLVYGASFCFALVFGLLPGLRTANLSVAEVLRSE